MIEISTFSLVLVFIKSDHGVLSIYPSLVTPSFGLHRSPSHHVSSIIASQELRGRIHSQSTDIELPLRLAIPQCVHLS